MNSKLDDVVQDPNWSWVDEKSLITDMCTSLFFLRYNLIR